VYGLIESSLFPVHLLGSGTKRLIPPRAILLHGPSGSGKSFVIRQLERAVAFPFIKADGASILLSMQQQSQQTNSKSASTTVSVIDELFARAHARAPCVLVIDDMDSIISGDRNNDNKYNINNNHNNTNTATAASYSTLLVANRLMAKLDALSLVHLDLNCKPVRIVYIHFTTLQYIFLGYVYLLCI